VFSIPSPRRGDRKHTTSWIKIIIISQTMGDPICIYFDISIPLIGRSVLAGRMSSSVSGVGLFSSVLQFSPPLTNRSSVVREFPFLSFTRLFVGGLLGDHLQVTLSFLVQLPFQLIWPDCQCDPVCLSCCFSLLFRL
jgi:hypothetical protein